MLQEVVLTLKDIWQCLETSGCCSGEGSSWHLLVGTRAAAPQPPTGSTWPTPKQGCSASPSQSSCLVNSDSLLRCSQRHLLSLFLPPEKSCHIFLSQTPLSQHTVYSLDRNSSVHPRALSQEWESLHQRLCFICLLFLAPGIQMCAGWIKGREHKLNFLTLSKIKITIYQF